MPHDKKSTENLLNLKKQDRQTQTDRWKDTVCLLNLKCIQSP